MLMNFDIVSRWLLSVQTEFSTLLSPTTQFVVMIKNWCRKRTAGLTQLVVLRASSVHVESKSCENNSIVTVKLVWSYQ
jgi:hypothetical protein